MAGLRRCLGLTVIGLFVHEGSAFASEPLPTSAERVATPGRNAASEETEQAIVLNPANLSYVPQPELRWTGVRCPDTKKIGCGHSLGVALPLYFGITTGLRV